MKFIVAPYALKILQMLPVTHTINVIVISLSLELKLYNIMY